MCAQNYALQSDKLLAYASLSQLIFVYADALWDPADSASIQEIEAVQNMAIKFFKS